jgi:WD40 repeat protein
MPKDGTPLTVAQIETVRQWIEQGAPFDGTSQSEPLDQQLPRPDYPQPPEVYPAAVPITAMAIRPETDHVYVAGFHELTVWNMSDGQLVRRINNIAERTYGLTFSPDGSLLAVAGGAPGTAGEARLLRAEDGTEVALLTTSSDVMFDIAFRPDGRKVAVALADGTIRIFDVSTGQMGLSIENHGDWVTAVCWTTDGEKLASASRDKTAKFFDADSGGLLATFSAHGQPVHDVVVSADGKQVFSAGADNQVRAWNPQDGKQIAEVARYGGEAFKLLVAEGQLFSTSADRIARQHQVEDRKEVRQFSGHTDWPISLAASLETKRLCAGCFDGRIGVWNLEDGSQVSSFLAAPGLATSDP